MNPIKINNAVDVLEVVPALLGFYPTESLWAIVLQQVEGVRSGSRSPHGWTCRPLPASRPPTPVRPPAPDQVEARSAWEERAASVAAYRELVGHDNEADPLGPPPKPGQIETYAAWRSAWRALGRPEADRAEAEMSTGQLRVRIRAYDRENAWAPDYVVDQLADTRQAADKHRQDSTLWEAQAAATAEPDSAARLRDDADKSSALAEALEDRASQLTEADEVRAAWYAHTAETRAAAERAAAELTTRQAGRDAEPPPVTAKEWLAAHEAEARAEDPHRRITDDHDLADTADQRARDQGDAGAGEPPAMSAESIPRDIREEAAEETDAKKPPANDQAADAVRVPNADETAESVRRAQRALQELKHRQVTDARRAEEEARHEVSLRQAEQQEHTTDHEAREGRANLADGAEPSCLMPLSSGRSCEPMIA